MSGPFMDVIIYERFQYQRRELDKGVSLVLDSVEYIGIIKLCSKRMHLDKGFAYKHQLVEQTPAQAKNFWTDDKLKKVGLYTSGSAHERDATRHLLYYLMQHGDKRYVNLLRPAPGEPDS
jgi:hypothetical protein